MLASVNDLIAGPDSVEWAKTNQGTVNDVKLGMFVLNSLNNILLVLVKGAQDLLQHHTALSINWSSIDKKPMATAKRQHAKLEERLTEVFEGSISPPECTLWDNSSAKYAEECKETMLLRAKLGVKNRSILINGGTPAELTNMPEPTSKRPSVGRDLNPRNLQGRKKHNDPANLGADELNGYNIIPQTTGYFKLPAELDAKPGEGISLCKKNSTTRVPAVPLGSYAIAPTNTQKISQWTNRKSFGTGSRSILMESRSMRHWSRQ